jgi:hypothetical protein
LTLPRAAQRYSSEHPAPRHRTDERSNACHDPARPVVAPAIPRRCPFRSAPRHLAAVLIDIGSEEANLPSVDLALDVSDELVEHLGDGGSSLGSDELIRSVEAKERDGGPTMLRLPDFIQQMVPDGERDAPEQPRWIGRELRLGRLLDTPLGRATQEPAGALSEPSTRSGSRAAVAWLTTIGGVLHGDVRLAAGPAMMNSRCDPPTRKKWKLPL